MAKKKGIVAKILLFVLLDVLFFAAFLPLFKDESPKRKSKSINELAASATGEYVLNISGWNEMVYPQSGIESFGTQKTERITINGNKGAVIIATGEGRGTVKATSGELVFKNITFKDERSENKNAWWDYIWFGERVTFENCTFFQSVYLESNAVATFKNCEFNSPKHDFYGAWVADGSAEFVGCTFLGYRGIKIHEFEGGDEVWNVSVKNCTFKNLSAKPGIVIGEFLGIYDDTNIIVENSTFTRCYPWDRVGSLHGIDGFYETDILFDDNVRFAQTGNKVDFVPPAFAIEYVGVEKGKYKTIYSELWKPNGNYPKKYVFGENCEVDDLYEVVWIGEREDRMFFGWYLDKECTVKFDGTVSETQIGTLTLYASISAGRWTNFH